jgi:tetratricopeptide (TPR) repeat protein
MDIFLSYSWADTEQADSIDTFFSSIGISVTRDVNSLTYRQSVKSFMSSIRDCDYAIILISNDYLKSPNCLFELIELYKEKEFSEKFLPIINDDTKVYSLEAKSEIVKYWQEKVESTGTLINTLQPTKTISLIEELKHYETIYSEIDSLLSSITDFKNISFSKGTNTNFKDIIEFIGLDNPDIKIEISRIQQVENQELQDIELERLKNSNPGNINILFAEGYINLTQRENYQKAKIRFEEYLKIQKDHAGLNNLGLCLYNLGELDRAENVYQEALGLSSSYETYFNIGNLQAQKKNYDKAIECWLKSVELNPNYSECLFNIGKTYTDMKGDFENGLYYYKKSVDLNPSLREAYNNIASIYIRQNNFKEAAIVLENGLEVNPHDHVAMYNLGAIYANVEGKVSESKSLYRKSIRENSNYISPKIGLAKLLILSGGDYDDAMEMFRDVLKIDPNYDDAKQLLDFLEKRKTTANKT